MSGLISTCSERCQAGIHDQTAGSTPVVILAYHNTQGVHTSQLTSQRTLHTGRPQPHVAHLVEGLAVVHANNRADHLRHDDHIPQVRAHGVRLLAARRLALRLAQLLNERQRLALQPALEPAGYPTPRVRACSKCARPVGSGLASGQTYSAHREAQRQSSSCKTSLARVLCAGSQQAILRQHRTATQACFTGPATFQCALQCTGYLVCSLTRGLAQVHLAYTQNRAAQLQLVVQDRPAQLHTSPRTVCTHQERAAEAKSA